MRGRHPGLDSTIETWRSSSPIRWSATVPASPMAGRVLNREMSSQDSAFNRPFSRAAVKSTSRPGRRNSTPTLSSKLSSICLLQGDLAVTRTIRRVSKPTRRTVTLPAEIVKDLSSGVFCFLGPGEFFAGSLRGLLSCLVSAAGCAVSGGLSQAPNDSATARAPTTAPLRRPCREALKCLVTPLSPPEQLSRATILSISRHGGPDKERDERLQRPGQDATSGITFRF